MIKKYVLDPEVLHDEEALVHFVRGLGVHEGRLLAHYPAKWLKTVNGHAQHASGALSAVRTREILVALQINGAYSIKSTDIPYNGNLSWVENVALRPSAFAAGLYLDGAVQDPAPPLYPISTLKGVQEPEYWRVTGAATTPNNRAPTLVKYLGPLLELEPEAVFMDPYFRPQRPYVEFILELFARLPSLGTLVLHSGQLEASSEQWQKSWWTKLHGRIPAGLTLTIVRWRGRDKERLHRRWVVNRRGGIGVDRGFPSNEYANPLSLLRAEEAARYWREFGVGPWTDGRYHLEDAFQLDCGSIKNAVSATTKGWQR